MIRIVIYVLVALNFIGSAVTQDEIPAISPEEELFRSFTQLSQADVDRQPGKLAKIYKRYKSLVEDKKDKCKARYMTVEIDKDGESVTSKRKLTKKERESCYRELKSFQIKYIEREHKQKKKFFSKIHKNFMQELDKNKASAVKRINKSYNRR